MIGRPCSSSEMEPGKSQAPDFRGRHSADLLSDQHKPACLAQQRRRDSALHVWLHCAC
ncbi:hypothetical protein B0T16DRAFT_117550 [Cercophora newfieldiana]|uniref:Uncharacterized protein n=1 Tax=Cercophora newfieldiana TaxID=92897 RepID=A0AA40CRJ3_9PEZI|nr:hypothetical protein B0T16DRAFT_117550 [Cercophora newfieldiana]